MDGKKEVGENAKLIAPNFTPIANVARTGQQSIKATGYENHTGTARNGGRVKFSNK